MDMQGRCRLCGIPVVVQIGPQRGDEFRMEFPVVALQVPDVVVDAYGKPGFGGISEQVLGQQLCGEIKGVPGMGPFPQLQGIDGLNIVSIDF